NRFVDFDLNTGWTPTGEMVSLEWDLMGESEAFAGWRGPIGDEESELSAEDFADLRLASSAEARGSESTRAQLHFDRGSHLFRFNRVEGPFVGLGARVIPPNPSEDRWELYGT